MVDHVKLFRNLPGLEWEGHIHEQILPSLRAQGGEIARLDCVVLHSGYDTSTDGQERKRVRDFKLLNLDLQERPQHPFVHFNMGMTLHYIGEFEPAVTYLRNAIRYAERHESHVRKAYALLVQSLLRVGRVQDSMEAVSEGLASVGEDPELFLLRAELRHRLGDRDGALSDCLAIRDLPATFQSIDMMAVKLRRQTLLKEVMN